MNREIKIRHPTDILPILNKWKKRREENFLAITLNGDHVVYRIHHITKGLLNRTIVHPRECFFPVIRDYSAAVMFIHNHPSGNAQPSHEDDVITERLSRAAFILGIHLLDHIIITPKDNFYSYRQLGKIKENFEDYEINDFIKYLDAGGEQ